MAPEVSIATRDGLTHLPDQNVDFAGHDVGAIAHDDNRWWALVDGHEVWSGSPGSWKQVAIIEGHRLNCIHPLDDGAVVGTSEARLARVGVDGDISFVNGFDEAEGRDEWFTPWGGPPDVRSLAIDGGIMFINVHVGGILKSADGQSFTPTIDIGSDVHEVIAPGGTLYAATAGGLATSDDRGTTWSWAGDGLHANYCRSVAVSGDALFISASIGPYGGRSAVYRRPLDDNGTFTKCSGGLPDWFSDNIDTGCLAGREGAVAFSTSDGCVLASEDRGITWTEAASGLQPARWLLMR
jgi:hypothetical protein